MADVRRQVAQVASESHAVGDRGGVVHGALHFSLGGLDGHQGDFLQGAWLGFLALELVELVFAVHQGFGQQAGLAIAVAALDHDFIQGQHCIAATQALERVEDAGDDLAERAVTQFFILAHADQQYAFGFQVRQAVQQQALANLAGQVAALEHCTDGAGAEFVELFGHSAELAAFADGNHQRGGLQRLRVDAFYNQFHVRVPELMVDTQALDKVRAALAYKERGARIDRRRRRQFEPRRRRLTTLCCTIFTVSSATVGASLLAKNLRAPRGVRLHALSLTTIASELAPTYLPAHCAVTGAPNHRIMRHLFFSSSAMRAV
ncbi:hypothetical protein D3C76_1039270 [compost metagenome]